MIPPGAMFSSTPSTVHSTSSGAPQSQTTTTTHTPLSRSISELPRSQTPDGTLRLRGGPIHSRRVTWSEEVIDNEGLGRKKSKVCCIFKRNREFGESSDESSSDDSSDSSDDSDIGDRKRKGGPEDGNKKCDKDHDHEHDNNHSHHRRKNPNRGNRRRPPSPNAYERMPRNATKKKDDSTVPSRVEPKPLS